MRLVGRESLGNFKLSHSDARSQIDSWQAEVKDAAWSSPQEMKEKYPKARPLSKQQAVFNICGNKYRLWVQVDYKRQIVLVKKIGTHKEYDKWDTG
jgi:mRNA interferase HigB